MPSISQPGWYDCTKIDNNQSTCQFIPDHNAMVDMELQQKKRDKELQAAKLRNEERIKNMERDKTATIIKLQNSITLGHCSTEEGQMAMQCISQGNDWNICQKFCSRSRSKQNFAPYSNNNYQPLSNTEILINELKQKSSPFPYRLGSSQNYITGISHDKDENTLNINIVAHQKLSDQELQTTRLNNLNFSCSPNSKTRDLVFNGLKVRWLVSALNTGETYLEVVSNKDSCMKNYDSK